MGSMDCSTTSGPFWKSSRPIQPSRGILGFTSKPSSFCNAALHLALPASKEKVSTIRHLDRSLLGGSLCEQPCHRPSATDLTLMLDMGILILAEFLIPSAMMPCTQFCLQCHCHAPYATNSAKRFRNLSHALALGLNSAQSI